MKIFFCRVIAEEDTAAKGDGGLVLTQDPTWLIDPIDGTYNYAHGLPLTCISIGLAINREVVVGVVYNPLSKSKYTAIKGQGAFINGRPIHVSKQQGKIILFPQNTMIGIFFFFFLKD